MKKLSLLILVISIFIASCNNDMDKNKNSDKKAKNVILFIGDGMSITHLYASMSVSETPLIIERFKYTGLQKTYSVSDYITDSGAAGTAIANGKKTKNGHIGCDSLGNPFKSILKYAEDADLSTGLVSTSSILHATPAAFIANNTDRNNYQEIALDFLKTDIDIFIGGGKKDFENREDGLNLIDSLINSQYQVTTKIDNLNLTDYQKFAVFTAEKHNPEYRNGRGEMLPKATEKAIEVLSQNNNGFFMMIEGSQIDWGGHDNDIDYIIAELLDFDRSVGKALEFAEKDGETLIIVTSDHETGGLTLVGGNMNNKTIEVNFSTNYHTADMVPVFAYGPGAEKFSGIYENTDVFHKMMQALGLE
ncbi:MAG TPA: alkaline phosphatase [Bacteroidales bacterium]|nr:alkaline phosphatase [Bacteroidales bacterium]